jgi:pyruvate dehydrogenase E1 component
VIFDGFSHQLPDIDPQETTEWLESFDAVVDTHGRSRARFLLMKLLERARAARVGFPATVSTPYVNTIPTDAEPWFPGDEHVERRIRAYIRWNAAVMVTRANMRSEGIGGHLSTYASSASLYEVGFNHFFHGKAGGLPGDQVFFQGHASPGIYARAFVEGRLTEEQLDNFRHEVSGPGLSSYPHPRLMPEFWEYPTVSMGLGPICAIYQARFNRYLLHREIVDTSAATVWAFVGDGEFDEPETHAALALAAREQLDNLVFVVNCNLQRLDGPVRGNGKIIQELEALLRGCGWNVVKVIWGSRWDELLARDVDGVLVNKMNITPDGEFQRLATESGAYIRENFFGPDPRLRKMVEHLSDADLQNLPRGGHDYRKVYAAYKAATEHNGAPTAVLAKTIKGWTLGPQIESRNATHQIKKMTKPQLALLRDRLYLQEEIPDEALEPDAPPYYRPPEDSPAYEYLMARRQALDGFLPDRRVRGRGRTGLPAPSESTFTEFLAGSRGQAVSTTMAFARMLRTLLRDSSIGRHVVPIIPDEGRTFGLDALFSEVKIYAAGGQRYVPVDAELLMSYAESQSGQILEEGITEAGAMAEFIAAGTAYSSWSMPMIPFFLFYSMFGFQRVGDLIWQAADARARGFLLGCTAGRTTLNGEGLQHEDGQSLLLASVVPNVKAYDPAFAYEVATIVEDGIRRLYGPEGEDLIYYLTLYNENYEMPPLPEPAEAGEAVRKGILEGMYQFAPGGTGERGPVTLFFSGTAWQAAMRARQMLADDWGVAADAWSVTSYKALREDALAAERWNRLHPEATENEQRTSYVHRALTAAGSTGPIVAVSDFVKAVPDQVARFVPAPSFTSLGTDGFGRSDTRQSLRRHFEVDAEHIVVAALDALSRQGDAKPEEVAEAIARYGIDAEAPDPLHA